MFIFSLQIKTLCFSYFDIFFVIFSKKKCKVGQQSTNLCTQSEKANTKSIDEKLKRIAVLKSVLFGGKIECFDYLKDFAH